MTVNIISNYAEIVRKRGFSVFREVTGLTPIVKINAGTVDNSFQSNSIHADTAATTETERSAVQSGQVVPEGLSGADELMSQLLDDRNEANTRPVSDTVLQALKEAGLPQNVKNINIVNSLLENGMPISRESIRAILASLKAFPETDISTIMLMAKSGVPMNSESVRTADALLNNVQVMLSDLNELTDMIESLLSNPETPEEVSEAIRQAVYDTITPENSAASQAASLSPDAGNTSIVNSEVSTLLTGTVSPETISASATAAAGIAIPAAPPEVSALPYRIVVEANPATLPEEPSTESGGESVGAYISGNSDGNGLSAEVFGESSAAEAGSAAQNINTSDNPASVSQIPAEAMSFSDQAEESAFPGSGQINEELVGRNDYSFRNFDELTASAEQAVRTVGAKPNPAELKHMLKQSLSINPKELSQERINELYKRANEFINRIKEASESFEHSSSLHEKAGKASENLKLLNDLNQMYPHIELPLKLENANAEGGLYVYSNRKGHSRNDNHATALLHLNMPNLGTVDIHLDLADRKLGLNFYSDDDARRLLSGDITSLMKRLEDMDYSVTTGFKSADYTIEDVKSQLSTLISGDPAERPERLGFDIRA